MRRVWRGMRRRSVRWCASLLNGGGLRFVMGRIWAACCVAAFEHSFVDHSGSDYDWYSLLGKRFDIHVGRWLHATFIVKRVRIDRIYIDIRQVAEGPPPEGRPGSDSEDGEHALYAEEARAGGGYGG